MNNTVTFGQLTIGETYYISELFPMAISPIKITGKTQRSYSYINSNGGETGVGNHDGRLFAESQQLSGLFKERESAKQFLREEFEKKLSIL
jgi:hypothetical protein